MPKLDVEELKANYVLSKNRVAVLKQFVNANKENNGILAKAEEELKREYNNLHSLELLLVFVDRSFLNNL